MDFDYPRTISSLSQDKRLLFYELLAHNLTIMVRGVWSDEEITDAEKVDRLKWLNESMHRITSKIRVLRLNEHEWTEEDSWQDIQHWVTQNKTVEPYVNTAVKWSYNSTVNSADRI